MQLRGNHPPDLLSNGPHWDRYSKKDIAIPAFIYEDGTLAFFEGRCRGYGAITGRELDHQDTIGCYLPDGRYYNFVIDLRVKCAVPTFMIEKEWFYYPILEFATMADGQSVVDWETGNLSEADPAT
jgi:hypothetical protein